MPLEARKGARRLPGRAKLTHEARRAGNAARTAIAPGKTADLAPIIAELRSIGATSLRALAAGLNERGIPTASGNSAMQVPRVLAR